MMMVGALHDRGQRLRNLTRTEVAGICDRHRGRRWHAKGRVPVAKRSEGAKREGEGNAPVGALERALSILQTFKSARERSIMEIATEVGLSRSTAYRLAEHLRSLGFLEINGRSGGWRLGREIIQLGVASLQSTDLMQVAPLFLQELLEEARESVNLGVFDSDSMVLVFREQGPQSVTISSRLGSHRPMHASSLGKAYLSAMQESERRVLFERLDFKRYSPHTLVTVKALERDIAESVKRGYTIDDCEFEPTLACCAAPVFDHRGIPVAAISASGPSERMLPQMDRVGPLVRNTAKSISERLGFLGRYPGTA